MVHKLTIAALFLLGALLGTGAAWPRPAKVPAAKYIVDGDNGFVHLNGRCKYIPDQRFMTKEEYKRLGPKLIDCPECLGKHENKQLAAKGK